MLSLSRFALIRPPTLSLLYPTKPAFLFRDCDANDHICVYASNMPLPSKMHLPVRSKTSCLMSRPSSHTPEDKIERERGREREKKDCVNPEAGNQSVDPLRNKKA